MFCRDPLLKSFVTQQDMLNWDLAELIQNVGKQIMYFTLGRYQNMNGATPRVQ